jgi:HSP20 family protein
MTVSLIKYEPFTELAHLRRTMDRLFDDSFFTPYRLFTFGLSEITPSIDMYQNDKEVVVKATLPGVKPEEVDVSVDGDCLTIKGETQGEEKVEQENYLYREHRHGTFHRTIALPNGLVTDKAKASFENGILTLTIPKAKETKPKRIKVKAEPKATHDKK